MRVQPKARGIPSIYTAIHQSVEPNRMFCIQLLMPDREREREGRGSEGVRESSTLVAHTFGSHCTVLYLYRIVTPNC